MPRNTSQPPKKFHYIWVGGDIPETYLQNIRTMAIFSRQAGVEINLWVDKSSNYYHLVDKNPSLQVPGLRVRLIDELPNLLSAVEEKNRYAYNEDVYKEAGSSSEPLYFSPDIAKKLLTYAQHEMVGLANYAASSDIYRELILYVEGGYYFDTDLVPELPLRGDAIKFELPKAPQGFQILSVAAPRRSMLSMINAAIAASPYHDITIDTLLLINKEYENLYEKAKKHGADFKEREWRETSPATFRWGLWGGATYERDPQYDLLALKRMSGDERKRLTIKCSGPDIFIDSIKGYIEKNKLSEYMDADGNHELAFPVKREEQEWEDPIVTIQFGNFGYKLKCDNTWFKPSGPGPKKGFTI